MPTQLAPRFHNYARNDRGSDGRTLVIRLVARPFYKVFNVTNFPIHIPINLESFIKSYTAQPVTIGEGGASVYFLQATAKPSLYLKMARPHSHVHFGPEVARLRWLKDRLPVPDLLYYGQDETGEYLLLSEIPGLMSCDPAFEGETLRVVKALAVGLKMLHSLEIKDCPFDARLDTQIEAAHQRTHAELVDETDFDVKHLGRTAAGLFGKLLKTRPANEDLVFTHGDYCLPNVILDPANLEVSGFIDLGRAGVADRYQDLALAARSLAYNWGEKFVPALFKEYGLQEQEVDRGKIKFYQFLDEFF